MKTESTNKLFLVRATLLSLFLVCFSSVYAQNLKELKRTNKEYMKELKAKGYKTVRIQTGDNGFWYFLVGKKVNGRNVYGVISKDKKELFDCKYTTVSYISQIEKSGYTDYTFRDFGGGRRTVSIYNHAMPGHFALYDSEADNTSIALVDGNIIKVFSDDYYRLGSWIITNLKEIYTKLDNLQRLCMLNKETKNMGIMTWDGKVLVKNVNNYIQITSKTDVFNNGTSVFCDYDGYKVGGFYLEKPEVVAPPIYEQLRFNDNFTIEVKLSPIDKMHLYNPNVIESFVPKNKGEKYYNANKYKECIEYYAKAGVADPDSKFYSAHAMFNIAHHQVGILENHVAAPLANSLYGYDYNESKSLLQNAIKILKIAAIQDTIRKDIYDENIATIKTTLNRLEVGNNKLAEMIKKENSFGNKLAKSVMQGLAEGIVNGATKSLSKALLGSSSSSGSNNKPVSSNNVASSSSSSKVASTTSNVSSVNSESSSSEKEEETESQKKEVKYRECGKCNGTGEIFTTSSNATYGIDKKVICDVCGKEHWLSTVHHHKKCHNCNGTGKVRM